MNDSALSQMFNIGATKNIGSGALAQYAPSAKASDRAMNAMQALQLARMRSGRAQSKAGMGLQERSTNDYLESLQAGPLDYIGLGLSGVGAIKGLDQRDFYKKFGYLPGQQGPQAPPLPSLLDYAPDEYPAE